ncbi:MAG: 5'-methylthioadenosine/S-adenosylhomocysteine nucleosidase [Candidatus Zixiibacteriota bacterium]
MCQPCGQYIVMYAFSEEGELLASKIESARKETILGRTVYIGKLTGKQIILAESGVGMTNAAMTTQKLIDEYHPKGLIFSGIAGAIDTTVHIGDIVVCDSWATHDYGYIGAEGFKPGGIWILPADVDSLVRKIYITADKALFSTALKLNASGFAFNSIGSRIPRLIVGGIGVSGNTFIDQVEKRLWLTDNFSALTTDMESAAVAQVCDVNGIPFIIFRSASDLAGGSGSESARVEIEQFKKVAATNSATVVLKYLEILEQ